MERNADARIYLADQRGVTETSDYQISHLFNHDSYTVVESQPFGPLRTLNEVTLRAGAVWSPIVTSPTTVLLLPITGGLEYRQKAESGFLEPGQAGSFFLRAGAVFELSNPYEKEFITFLHIELAASGQETASAFRVVAFDSGESNLLQPLMETDGRRGFLGRFAGRQEGTYAVETPGGNVFVFVLQGVFEVANRLLHSGDGLALHYSGIGHLEFEALSENAILLLLDLGP